MTVQVYFTSGTTGAPKMVGHTHSSYGYCHQVMAKYWLDLTRDDIMWNISDTGWAKVRGKKDPFCEHLASRMENLTFP